MTVVLAYEARQNSAPQSNYTEELYYLQSPLEEANYLRYRLSYPDWKPLHTKTTLTCPQVAGQETHIHLSSG